MGLIDKPFQKFSIPR